MKKQKLIPVLVFKDVNSGEPEEVYRLDKEDQAIDFFNNLLHNVEEKQVHHICIERWTRDQWRLAELVGLSITGEISSRQNKQRDALHKKKVKHPVRQWPTFNI